MSLRGEVLNDFHHLDKHLLLREHLDLNWLCHPEHKPVREMNEYTDEFKHLITQKEVLHHNYVFLVEDYVSNYYIIIKLPTLLVQLVNWVKHVLDFLLMIIPKFGFFFLFWFLWL